MNPTRPSHVDACTMTTLDMSCPPRYVGGVSSASYPANPRALRHARRHVDTVLAQWGVEPDVRCAALYIVSELVTNAICHTETTCVDLVLQRKSQRRLRIEVSDSEPALIPQIGSPDVEDESGRGLLLVRNLSQEYGVTTGAAHKTVWAELD